MKVYAINGSPRKNFNTATLLKKALDGVSIFNPGVETELINLYEYKFQGCISCFQCKRIGGPSYGKCVVKDDITGVLEKLSMADGIIFGSPIYLQNITGQLKSFLERLIYPYLVYGHTDESLAPKQMPTAFIYTMNITQAMMDELCYSSCLERTEQYIKRMFSKPAVMYCCDTYQFDDYSNYKCDGFSEIKKAGQREKQFPLDCEKAFEIGKNLLK